MTVATAPARGRRPRARSAARRAEATAGWILSLPAVIVFTIFMFVPLGLTVWYSLHRYSGFGRMRWLGAKNYERILQDDIFWHALLNTVVYTAVSVPLGIAIALGAAMLLNKAMPARGLFRALIYVPVVISGVASGVIFLRLFDPVVGLVNQVLSSVGLPTVDWQGSGTAALVSVIVVTTWQGIGFGMVVYLAALQGIPSEVYEAADLDGASPLRQFWNITLPLLRPTTFFMIVYSIIGSFQVFDVVYVMTRGGPGTATTFLVQYAYDTGFNQRQHGYAAAIGVILYVIVLVFTVVQWFATRSRDEA